MNRAQHPYFVIFILITTLFISGASAAAEKLSDRQLLTLILRGYLISNKAKERRKNKAKERVRIKRKEQYKKIQIADSCDTFKSIRGLIKDKRVQFKIKDTTGVNIKADSICKQQQNN